jgi:hypothetical protein
MDNTNGPARYVGEKKVNLEDGSCYSIDDDGDMWFGYDDDDYKDNVDRNFIYDHCHGCGRPMLNIKGQIADCGLCD